MIQIAHGGWPTLRRKLARVQPWVVRSPLLIVELPASILFVLIIRLIGRFYLVRFQRLINWRIGHYAANTELYLCERDAGINTPDIPYVDFWYRLGESCNEQLDVMCGRTLNIGPQYFLILVKRINALIPGGEAHLIGDNTSHDRDVHNLLERFPPHLNFLPDEEDRGEAGLRSLGIPDGAPFVCLQVRDSSYLQNQSPHLDWSRHDYRDCDIQKYVQASMELANRGYYVVRMGAVVKQAMAVDHPMIIDYATNGMRSDFMDIYLGAKCVFCISNGTGFDAVPYIFRRPIVYVDQAPLGYIMTFCSNALATTKKHWLRDKGRFMTFREIFESGAAYSCFSAKFEEIGVELVESAPEEITAVVVEMDERLRGTWHSSKEDKELQRLFWDIFPKNELHGDIRSHFGADYLRRHKDWLS